MIKCSCYFSFDTLTCAFMCLFAIWSNLKPFIQESLTHCLHIHTSQSPSYHKVKWTDQEKETERLTLDPEMETRGNGLHMCRSATFRPSYLSFSPLSVISCLHSSDDTQMYICTQKHTHAVYHEKICCLPNLLFSLSLTFAHIRLGNSTTCQT